MKVEIDLDTATKITLEVLKRDFEDVVALKNSEPKYYKKLIKAYKRLLRYYMPADEANNFIKETMKNAGK